MRLPILLLALVLAIVAPVCIPASFALDAPLYLDQDPAAVAFHPPPGGRAQFRQQLAQRLQKNPKDAVALVHRAYLFLNGGHYDNAHRDFTSALAASRSGSVLERHILWSRGWAEYDVGNVSGALRDWQRAERLHGGHPYWTSYSYALAYWTLNVPDQALTWFNATVAAMPEWGTETGFNEHTQHWRPIQRERMRELFNRWRAQSLASPSLPPTTESPAN